METTDRRDASRVWLCRKRPSLANAASTSLVPGVSGPTTMTVTMTSTYTSSATSSMIASQTNNAGAINETITGGSSGWYSANYDGIERQAMRRRGLPLAVNQGPRV